MSLRDRWKYTRLRPKNTATHTRYRNWLSTRYHARGTGKAPLPDRMSQAVTSRAPVVRNRVNPATGRPRWTDRSGGDLTRWSAGRDQLQRAADRTQDRAERFREASRPLAERLQQPPTRERRTR